MEHDARERLKRSLKILKSKGLLDEYAKKKMFGDNYQEDEEAMKLLEEVEG